MDLEKKVSFEEFVCTMEEKAIAWLGNEYEVERKHVLKNNGVALVGLVIRKSDELIVPSIYMNEYFAQYEDGRDVMDIWNEIIHVYISAKENTKIQFRELSYQFEDMKNSIVFRLINYEKNEELLNQVPHMKVMDFAITFHCLVRNDEDGVGTIRITKEHCTQWGVVTEDLYVLAMKNTPMIFPASIRRMEDIMRELMKKEMLSFSATSLEDEVTLEDRQKEAEKAANEFIQLLQLENPKRKVDMFVLSNEKGINGASCILYPEVLSNFASELNNDFFILPSSVHELILVPFEEHLGTKQLKEMVMEINQTQVPLDEVLSDEIYCYSRVEKQMIGIA